MKKNIDTLKEKLNNLILYKAIESSEVQELSKEIDELILDHYRMQRKRSFEPSAIIIKLAPC